jgi:hypothetical protein
MSGVTVEVTPDVSSRIRPQWEGGEAGGNYCSGAPDGVAHTNYSLASAQRRVPRR